MRGGDLSGVKQPSKYLGLLRYRAFLYREAFLRPIRRKIRRNGNDLNVGESSLLQRTECRPDVRATVHRAATAVEDDLRTCRELRCLLLQQSHAGIRACGASENRALNMVAVIEYPRAHHKNHRRATARKRLRQIGRGDALLGFPGIGRGLPKRQHTEQENRDTSNRHTSL